ncbi:MAG: hypothetical protein IIU39_00940 [Ruminococcus sp.]|nr:hypothetical protein [Ruminococcus sp.]
MKKLITAAIISVIALSSFTGCGMVQDMADDATQMVTDASDAVSEAASDIAADTNGKVNDDDGIIGNDDKENTND